jgi:lysophospholipase L1-like esterase
MSLTHLTEVTITMFSLTSHSLEVGVTHQELIKHNQPAIGQRNNLQSSAVLAVAMVSMLAVATSLMSTAYLKEKTPQSLFDDGVHPNAAGHELIFKTVLPEFNRLIQKT